LGWWQVVAQQRGQGWATLPLGKKKVQKILLGMERLLRMQLGLGIGMGMGMELGTELE
jgi:hypothetical protein